MFHLVLIKHEMITLRSERQWITIHRKFLSTIYLSDFLDFLDFKNMKCNTNTHYFYHRKISRQLISDHYQYFFLYWSKITKRPEILNQRQYYHNNRHYITWQLSIWSIMNRQILTVIWNGGLGSSISKQMTLPVIEEEQGHVVYKWY